MSSSEKFSKMFQVDRESGNSGSPEPLRSPASKEAEILPSQEVCSPDHTCLSSGASSTADASGADIAVAGACASESPAVEKPLVEEFRRRWTTADRVGAVGTCTNVRAAYLCGGMLGAGAYGRTFYVRNTTTGEEVALKLCSFRRMSRPSMVGTADLDDGLDHPVFDEENIGVRVGRLRLETLLVRSLSELCPFVAGMVKDLGDVCDVWQGEMGFAVPLMTASLGHVWELWQFCLPTGTPSAAAFNSLLVFVAAQLADAVRFLHGCGVVHMDISHNNVLMAKDGYVRLIDFGKSFVETAGPYACAPPKSVAWMNEWHQKRARDYGPPEEAWMAILHHRDGAEAGFQLGRPMDLHMLGYLLQTLDWPLDLNRPPYREVDFDFEGPSTFEEFCATYRVTRVPQLLSEDLRDFAGQLTRVVPSERLGFQNPDDIIRHKVFCGIDFDRLRQKQLPAPLDDVLERRLRGPVSVVEPDRVSNPWQSNSTLEEEYAAMLAPAEKEYFWRVFTNQP